MDEQLYCPLLVISSYLLGSVSSAILVTRVWARKDIRTLGNRNAGAANVGRSVEILPAALVVIADFAKGAIPVLVAQGLNLHEACALTGATAAVIGHSFPIYFRFRGGKGLAASLGAQLSDSAHVFMDPFALELSFLALRAASLPGNDKHTYGFHRMKAALFKGATLFLIAFEILREAWDRFQNPQMVQAGPLLVITLVGLIINLTVAFALREHDQDELNTRSAFLHVLGDPDLGRSHWSRRDSALRGLAMARSLG